MEIQNNIIKYNLKNVLFICGTACGGKTTMAKILAAKYGFCLYDMDKMYEQHRKIAEERYQPDTCYHMKNFHEQWTRSIEEQARWNINCMKEQTEMVLIDLMKMSRNQTVVADVLYSPVYTQNIVDYNQIVFLTVSKSVLRTQYFDRPEKRDFYEFVMVQPMADVYLNNIIKGLELTNDLEQQSMYQSDLKVIERKSEDSRDSLLQQIEVHFGLCK